MRVLILGGTTEASALARLLAADARHEATLSLAGRTARPLPQPVPVRSGGFGGVAGLVEHLDRERIEAVVDATHPYAARMSVNAVAACAEAGVPLASLRRPAWERQPGDLWQEVPSTAAAAAALGDPPRRVFVTVGRQELHVFAAAPQHRYVARLIETPDQDGLPPDLVLLRQRGPFDRAAEERLLREQAIDVVVSKNAGGSATYAKIAATRALGLPVVMIARPDKPVGHVVASPEAALAWLDHQRSLRGV
ncbi:cobalt-precorrin-6A reductase [Reyranella sp.]|uniref:cobalt-precorrin-6A reductase n=1 Tax=Reyranella sp. TaxID=1929291 RepID=UPI003BAD2F31